MLFILIILATSNKARGLVRLADRQFDIPDLGYKGKETKSNLTRLASLDLVALFSNLSNISRPGADAIKKIYS